VKRSLDIYSLLHHLGKPIITEGHKHARPGWVQTTCPFCAGNPGYHLGYNLQDGFFNCWRCGFHKTIDTIQALAGVNREGAIELLKRFSGTAVSFPSTKETPQKEPFRYPSGVKPLGPKARKFLEKRGIDSSEAADLWGALETGPTSYLDGVDYRFRILIPITLEGQVVSFTARDWTGKAKVRYKACPAHLEIVNRKKILYGEDKARAAGFSRVVVVEGPLDVWKLGPGAVATLGASFSPAQVLRLRRFKSVLVMMDNDPAGHIAATRLCEKLSAIGVPAQRIRYDAPDPGSLPDSEVADVRKLLK